MDSQLKDTALPPSPIPRSVVPLEFTAWMVNRLRLLLRQACLFAGCSLAGGLGDRASSCLWSSFSSSVVSGGPESAPRSPQALVPLGSVARLWEPLPTSVSPWSPEALTSAETALSDGPFGDGSGSDGPAASGRSCSSEEKAEPRSRLEIHLITQIWVLSLSYGPP